MTHLGADAEEALENATLALFAELGWETVNGYHEVTSETPDAGTGGPYLGRPARYEVVLRPRLEAALTRLNPTLPSEALHQAVVELTRDRSAMTLVHANREVYALLKDGVPVTYRDAGGEERVERVAVIDWNDPADNDFLMVQQFWVTGDIYTRRALTWSASSTACRCSSANSRLTTSGSRTPIAETSATTRTPFPTSSGTTVSCIISISWGRFVGEMPTQVWCGTNRTSTLTVWQ